MARAPDLDADHRLARHGVGERKDNGDDERDGQEVLDDEGPEKQKTRSAAVGRVTNAKVRRRKELIRRSYCHRPRHRPASAAASPPAGIPAACA
jgi:hypothetical protein